MRPERIDRGVVRRCELHGTVSGGRVVARVVSDARSDWCGACGHDDLDVDLADAPDLRNADVDALQAELTGDALAPRCRDRAYSASFFFRGRPRRFGCASVVSAWPSALGFRPARRLAPISCSTRTSPRDTAMMLPFWSSKKYRTDAPRGMLGSLAEIVGWDYNIVSFTGMRVASTSGSCSESKISAANGEYADSRLRVFDQCVAYDVHAQ